MKRTTIVIPVAMITVAMMMVVPVPSALLDLMLSANLTLGILVLLGVVLLKDNLDFSVFPSLLLVTALIRLALNVSSTRLILLDGYAGKVIDSFGGFVIGRSVVVGLVVFLILVIIQFAVITNGTGRVAEVAARFTLDAMPGKQMAIDADLNAGLIDEAEARARRSEISREADFYGAMDGAVKFVKGDAIASIVIVAINLFGGLAIGVGSLGLSFGDAVDTFASLTVGDGLVSQIPALLISISAGLLVTRVGSDEAVGAQLGLQIAGNPGALRIAGGVAVAMALMPGLPKVPFFLVGGALMLAGTARQAAVTADEAPGSAEPVAEIPVDPDAPEALLGSMKVEPLELRLSYDILDLIDVSEGGDLLERVRALRREIAKELGIVMPAVRTRDDVSLPPATYSIVLRGAEVGRGNAPRGRIMALPAGDGTELAGLSGTETEEPVFGLKAYWLPEAARSECTATGATVVDRSSVVVTHLAEVVRTNAASLLSRQDVQMLVEGLRYDEPILANEVGTEHLSLGALHAVLRRLLDDRVPVRDLAAIVEAVGTAATDTRSVEALANAARVALGRSITAAVAPDGKLAVLTLSPVVEAEMHESLRDVDGVVHLALDPTRLEAVRADLERAFVQAANHTDPAVIVCGQTLRRPLERTTKGMGFEIPVLAYPELPATVSLTPIGVIGLAHAHS